MVFLGLQIDGCVLWPLQLQTVAFSWNCDESLDPRRVHLNCSKWKRWERLRGYKSWSFFRKCKWHTLHNRHSPWVEQKNVVTFYIEFKKRLSPTYHTCVSSSFLIIFNDFNYSLFKLWKQKCSNMWHYRDKREQAPLSRLNKGLRNSAWNILEMCIWRGLTLSEHPWKQYSSLISSHWKKRAALAWTDGFTSTCTCTLCKSNSVWCDSYLHWCQRSSAELTWWVQKEKTPTPPHKTSETLSQCPLNTEFASWCRSPLACNLYHWNNTSCKELTSNCFKRFDKNVHCKKVCFFTELKLYYA